MVAEPQRLTLATVLACVSWGGVAVPECSVDVLGVDKVVPSPGSHPCHQLYFFQQEGSVVIGVTNHQEQLCHKVKAKAVLKLEEGELEEGLVLGTPLLMCDGEGLVLQEEGISFVSGEQGVLCRGVGEAEEVWEAVKQLVGKHAVPRRAEVRLE